MRKIKRNFTSDWWLVVGGWLLLISLLVYTRFLNLGWGLPYPMHPDERNMTVALQQMQCKEFPNKLQFSIHKLLNCMNPHFFAYGQFPLYLGYFLVYLLKFFDGDLQLAVSFQEAVFSLRLISAMASVLTWFVLLGVLGRLGVFEKKSFALRILSLLIIIFSPGFIQLAHFGTTESLLILLYSLIIYCSLLYTQRSIPRFKFLVLSSFLVGLALATKVSSIVFVAVPVVAVILNLKNQRSNPSEKFKALNFAVAFVLCALIFAVIFSPHNILHWREFLSSMRYEGYVALGRIIPFYTRQFAWTVPIVFQALKIFPYALGWPVLVLGILGLLGPPSSRLRRVKEINLLRFAFLIYFMPNAFLFAKWTRFMAPIFPLILVFAILFISKIKNRIVFWILILASIIPGIIYLSIYQKPDIRFQASEWIYKNVPAGSYILTETANVVNLPLEVKSYKVVSFNFYDLDENTVLQNELREHLAKADYIIVPSRRIFMNHSKEIYPLLNNYYEKLFSGKLGFAKVIQFDAGLLDETAEETWSVFDHPVIRIYRKS